MNATRFCTNDPAKKWGAGSGLWRSKNGGETFDKVTSGLPGGKLGRIGLDWYRTDPNVVFMVLESEAISQEPEDAAYMGIEAEDVSVGARLTKVVADSPAAEAELQVGDVVVELAGERVHSWKSLRDKIGRHLAGQTVQVVVARDGEDVEGEVTFTMKPSEEEDKGADPAANETPEAEKKSEKPAKPEPPKPGPFTAYLGGQRANAQDQQGPDGHEYGGVYRSDDAGISWKRINSLNPRPMYFSEIRVDPSDDQHIYVLGISLHRSKDGGKTFTSDGHGRGVHVDHHALWIDPRDGRHIVLGNDGGLYVTRDRMDNWDHLNHVAIGQFYHVTADAERNYRVYGGLQDNGTWGGPSRVRDGSGPGHDDWLRIGGGDGFVCRVDPEDPDQIYYESQNGGLGSRNLRTGERDFMRPRAPRGTRYRFNWNTPFLLSQHNSQIYLTAGNHVFRSWRKGNSLEAISPDITRTERGSATALAESPRDPNLIWVGTDDGALWYTQDGGHEWTDVFADRVLEDAQQGVPDPSAVAVAVTSESNEPAAREEGAAAEVAQTRLVANDVGTASAQDAATKHADAPARERAASDDGLSGTWTGKATGASLDENEGHFALELTLNAEGQVDGHLSCDIGEGSIERGSYKIEHSQVSFRWVGDFAVLDFDGKLESGAERPTLRGTISAGDGSLAFEFVAQRDEARALRVVKVSSASTGDATAQKTEPAVQRSAGQSAAGDAPNESGDSAPAAATQEQEESEAAEAPAGPSLGELVPHPHRVAAIALSRFEEERVYVAFDGHRTDDDRPHVFVSEDGGTSWSSLTTDLPESAGSVRALEEDLKNKNLLYLGTEFGLWCSLDRGQSWTHINNNLPTVPVHAIAQPPAADELVAGTHGRSIWILDVSALRQMKPEILEQDAHLFQPPASVRWRSLPSHGTGGPREFVGQNPSSGARIAFYLKKKPSRFSLRVVDEAGELVRELTDEAEAGLNVATWDLRRARDEALGGRG